MTMAMKNKASAMMIVKYFKILIISGTVVNPSFRRSAVFCLKWPVAVNQTKGVIASGKLADEMNLEILYIGVETMNWKVASVAVPES